MTTKGIQISVQHTNANLTPSFYHGRAQRPLIIVRVVLFDGFQTRTSVSASNSVNPTNTDFSESCETIKVIAFNGYTHTFC